MSNTPHDSGPRTTGWKVCLRVLSVLFVLTCGAAVAASSPLHSAAARGDAPLLGQLLTTEKDSINSLNEHGQTPLFLAAGSGSFSSVEVLLQHKAAVNQKCGPDEMGPLAAAALNGRGEVVRLLLKNGAQIDARTKRLEPPLFLAAAKGNREVAGVLLDALAGVDLTDLEGRTALIAAARGGHLETVNLLLENGANPNATMASGESALFVAVEAGHIEIVKALLEMGSLATFVSSGRETPLSVARRRGDEALIKILEKARARMPDEESAPKVDA